MREALRRLRGEVGVYGFGQFVGRAVQLLLVPILTRVLHPEAYGVAELVLAYSQTAVLVLVFGMDGAVARFFYSEPDREARIRLASSALAFRLATSITAALLIVAASSVVAGGLFGGEAYRKYVLIASATLPCTLIVMFSNDLLRVTFQPWKFIVLNVAQTVLATGLSIWFVIGQHVGVVGLFYGRLAADALCAVLGLVLVRHTIRPVVRLEPLGRLLRYGLPLVPGALAFGVVASVDRYVLQRMRSLEEVAIYAVAAKFFAVVSVGISAFQLSYGPMAFAQAGSPDAPRFYARVFALFAAVGSTSALAVSLFAPEVLTVLVPRAYWPARGPAIGLAFAAVCLGLYFVSSIGAALALRTGMLARVAVGVAVIATAAQFAMVPRWGTVGASAATLLGYASAAVLTYRLSQRVHPLPLPGRDATLMMAVALVIAVLGQRFLPATIVGTGIKVACVALFGYAVFTRWLRAPGASTLARNVADEARAKT